MPLFRITVQTLLLSLSLPAFSQYADASELPLAESPSWRALLHFPRQTPLFKEVTKSYIDDRRFFLAEDGDQNRKAEFDASLAAFAAKPTETACRFPARYLWLHSQHLVPAGLLSDCGEYNEWRDKIDIERVVLVLAASYLNSPSSMYGHTFLRLVHSCRMP